MAKLANIKVASSPWGSDDQRGALNRMTPQSQAQVLARADGSRIYDLSVDFFVGMPSFQAAGDPAYQMFMSHTPNGTIVDNLNNAGAKINKHVCYSGEVVFFYTHTGTHIDSFSHFGVNGMTYNNAAVDENLGSRHWYRNGAEQIPPIIARGVLLDIAGLHEVECLPESYGITQADCERALERQEVALGEGDIALVRTGRMKFWPDGTRVMGNPPGMSLEASRWITSQGIIAIGADQECVEVGPSEHEDNWLPGHCHFLAEAGCVMMELLDLESLARDKVYELCFIGAPIRFRGATGAPLRPLAMPLRGN
ncbi:MAG: cyclase family protein [Verrucomicrobia bacterium]|jgi:kynurenine formamidase|nr:cyclase family protein [Verrucomicrobiota bacterium]